MKSISDIVNRATNCVKATLPPLTQQSPPIPVGSGEDLRAAFLYFRGEFVNPELRYQVWPPSHVASFRMHDGLFQELVAVTPASFHLEVDAELPLGAGIAPLDKMEPTYLAQLARYYQSLDLLLPSFAAAEPRSEKLAAAAADAQDALSKILEAPQHVYLQRLGSVFLDWLKTGPGHANSSTLAR